VNTPVRFSGVRISDDVYGTSDGGQPNRDCVCGTARASRFWRSIAWGQVAVTNNLWNVLPMATSGIVVGTHVLFANEPAGVPGGAQAHASMLSFQSTGNRVDAGVNQEVGDCRPYQSPSTVDFSCP